MYLVAINIITVLIFAWDKFRASTGGWRTRESTLLLVSALGGTPAAFLAREILPHKNRKQPFGKFLITIAAAQIILVGGFVAWRLFQAL